jgi:predicted RNA polymerase sigma factor
MLGRLSARKRQRGRRLGIPTSRPADLLIDRLRRTTLIDGKHREPAIDLTELERETPDIEATLDEDIDDDLLRLIFAACHPGAPNRVTRRPRFASAGRTVDARNRARIPNA